MNYNVNSEQGIKIVHLSDLHIGMLGYNDGWKPVRDYLITTLKPQLVLITGDIADSPERQLFDTAAGFFDELKRSGIACLVCAGNHDRHVQGVSIDAVPPGRIKRFLKWFVSKEKQRQPRDPASPASTEDEKSASLFDQIFSNVGMLVQLGNPIDKTLSNSTENLQWIVRIVALDSSIESKILAQGHISPDMLARFRNTARYSGKMEDAPHLLIALIHHHLLPVTELEKGRQELIDIKKTTTVLNNAGSVMKALAEVGTDIVLHGHEHCHHVARFGLVGSRNDEILVIGAGSATGAVTDDQCHSTLSSFNIFTLRKDRSVLLEKMKYNGSGSWERDGDICELLSGIQIRQARYMRWHSDKALPKSRQERHFTFTHSRDARIREIKANWPIKQGKFVVKTINWTGEPYFMGGSIELATGQSIELDQFKKMDSLGMREFTYDKDIGSRNEDFIASRIEHEIIWFAGGILAQEDLLRCDIDTMGPLRSHKREFVATLVEYSLESLSMSIELPDEYAPESNRSYRVLAGIGLDSINWVQNQELTNQLRFLGKTRIRLDIPYPLPGYLYAIEWDLPDIPPVSSALSKKREDLKLISIKLVDDVMATIKRKLPKSSVNIGLYLPQLENKQHGRLVFKCIACKVDQCKEKNEGKPHPETWIIPLVNSNLFCGAHWGVPRSCFLPDHGMIDAYHMAAGLQNGENALFAIPLSTSLRQEPMTESLAIVRIGFLSSVSNNEANATLLLRLVTAAVQAGSAEAMFQLTGD